MNKQKKTASLKSLYFRRFLLYFVSFVFRVLFWVGVLPLTFGKTVGEDADADAFNSFDGVGAGYQCSSCCADVVYQ